MKQAFAFIGDIHGTPEPLASLLPVASKDAERVVFLGDYLNRGHDSRAVLDILCEFKIQHEDRATFLYGHHEAVAVQAIRLGRSEGFLRMGGAATLRQYPRRAQDGSLLTLRERFPPEHIDFLFGLQKSLITPEIFAQHDEAWGPSPAEGQFGVYGHQPQISRLPDVSDSRALIDTGCGTLENGPLTCLFWPSKEWVQVE